MNGWLRVCVFVCLLTCVDCVLVYFVVSLLVCVLRVVCLCLFVSV